MGNKMDDEVEAGAMSQAVSKNIGPHCSELTPTSYIRGSHVGRVLGLRFALGAYLEAGET